MLHVDRTVNPAGQWAHQGYQSIASTAPTSITRALYFALTELAAAADAQDGQAVTDLVVEVGVVGELLLRTASDPMVLSVSLELWGQVQHAAGAGDHPLIALHALTMRRMLPPPGERGEQDTPVYVPAGERLGAVGTPLPEVGVADPPMPTDPAAGFLVALVAALIDGRGHLIDPDSGRAPAGAVPERVGWSAGSPTGPMTGWLSMNDEVLVLDPHRSVEVARTVLPEVAGPAAMARLLAQRWLIDSTLLVDEHTVRRYPSISAVGSGWGDHGPAWVWSMPITHWDASQFRGQSTRRRLRVVPNGSP